MLGQELRRHAEAGGDPLRRAFRFLASIARTGLTGVATPPQSRDAHLHHLRPLSGLD